MSEKLFLPSAPVVIDRSKVDDFYDKCEWLDMASLIHEHTRIAYEEGYLESMHILSDWYATIDYNPDDDIAENEEEDPLDENEFRVHEDLSTSFLNGIVFGKLAVEYLIDEEYLGAFSEVFDNLTDNILRVIEQDNNKHPNNSVIPRRIIETVMNSYSSIGFMLLPQAREMTKYYMEDLTSDDLSLESTVLCGAGIVALAGVSARQNFLKNEGRDILKSLGLGRRISELTPLFDSALAHMLEEPSDTIRVPEISPKIQKH